jgi:hypothetical protein
VLVASWAVFTSATLAVVVMRSIRYHRLGPHPVAGLLLLIGLLVDIGRRFAARRTLVVAQPKRANNAPVFAEANTRQVAQ